MPRVSLSTYQLAGGGGTPYTRSKALDMLMAQGDLGEGLGSDLMVWGETPQGHHPAKPYRVSRRAIGFPHQIKFKNSRAPRTLAQPLWEES